MGFYLQVYRCSRTINGVMKIFQFQYKKNKKINQFWMRTSFCFPTLVSLYPSSEGMMSDFWKCCSTLHHLSFLSFSLSLCCVPAFRRNFAWRILDVNRIDILSESLINYIRHRSGTRSRNLFNSEGIRHADRWREWWRGRERRSCQTSAEGETI